MKLFLRINIALVLGGLMLVSVQSAWAYTDPTAAPPGGDVAAPINTSATTQTKPGSLLANVLKSFYDLYVEGNLGVGLGTISPSAKVDVIKAFGGAGAGGSILQLTGSNVSDTNYNFLRLVHGVSQVFSITGNGRVTTSDDVCTTLGGTTKCLSTSGTSTTTPSSSQWTTSVNNIYNANPAYVGVGTGASPGAKLDILNTDSNVYALRATNTGAGANILSLGAYGTPNALTFKQNTNSSGDVLVSPRADVGLQIGAYNKNVTLYPSNGRVVVDNADTTGTSLEVKRGNLVVTAGNLKTDGGTLNINGAAGQKPFLVSVGNDTYVDMASGISSTGIKRDMSIYTGYYPTWSGPQVYLKNDGNVGIGTNAPTAKLDVNGTIAIRGGVPGAGKVLLSDVDGDAMWATLTNQFQLSVLTFTVSPGGGDAAMEGDAACDVGSFAIGGGWVDTVKNAVAYPVGDGRTWRFRGNVSAPPVTTNYTAALQCMRLTVQ